MLGTINVIFAKPGNSGGLGAGVMSVNEGCDLEASDRAPKRARLVVTPTLGFSEKDKEETFQSLMMLWWLSLGLRTMM